MCQNVFVIRPAKWSKGFFASAETHIYPFPVPAGILNALALQRPARTALTPTDASPLRGAYDCAAPPLFRGRGAGEQPRGAGGREPPAGNAALSTRHRAR